MLVTNKNLKITVRRVLPYVFCFFVVIVPSFVAAQPGIYDVPNNQKIGGVCFRVDDIHPISDWYAYAKVFEKYGYHFTFAQNLELVDAEDDYYQMIRNLQSSGDEMADHSPNHKTLYFTAADISPYAGLAGVDHIVSNTVYLSYDPAIDTSLYNGQAAPGGCVIDIVGGMAYSRTPGAFKDFVKENGYLWGVYIPGTGQLFNMGSLSNVWAADSNDIDTLALFSFWGENIPIKDTAGVWCHFVGQYNVHLTNDALSLLVQRTLDLADAHGVQRPTVWIEPGGLWPCPDSTQVDQVIGGQHGYDGAASDPAISLKCYNEYDPLHEKRFGMEWGDFLEDENSLSTVETIISNDVALHRFLVGHSHFNNLLGGWDGYLGRMDSLLAWCQANSARIQVVTYSEMAHLLYDVPQNPYVNIIPPLNVDLNNDGVPDGYWISTVASLDTTDGTVPEGGYSLKTSSWGTICTISNLAGLEKGANDFSIWTKGATGDTISVRFSMAGYPDQVFKFPAVTGNWVNYTTLQSVNGDTSLSIPYDISTVNIDVSCINCKTGPVKISGMSLRKKLPVPLKIVSQPDTVVAVGKQFVGQLEAACTYPGDVISYQLVFIACVAPDQLDWSFDGDCACDDRCLPGHGRGIRPAWRW